jgi:hypothetical protein
MLLIHPLQDEVSNPNSAPAPSLSLKEYTLVTHQACLVRVTRLHLISRRRFLLMIDYSKTKKKVFGLMISDGLAGGAAIRHVDVHAGFQAERGAAAAGALRPRLDA